MTDYTQEQLERAAQALYQRLLDDRLLERPGPASLADMDEETRAAYIEDVRAVVAALEA